MVLPSVSTSPPDDSDRSQRLNGLLAALPEPEFQRLAPHLVNVKWALGQVLYEPLEPVKTVYFPNQAMVSLVRVMQDGSTVEAGIVGNDGILGYSAYLGGSSMASRAIVQIAGSAIALDAAILQAEFSRGGALQRLLLRYTQALIAQISQTAACNRFHAIDARLARWLLQSRDFSQSIDLQLTQDFLASMLGTRRASVTVAARNLQEAGFIHYHRGRIKILQETGLESAACECYRTVQTEYQRLLESFAPSP